MTTNKNDEEKTGGGFNLRKILLFILLLLFVLAIASYQASDSAVLDGGVAGTVKNLIGPWGARISRILFYLFGVAVYPILLLFLLCLLRSFLKIPAKRNGYVWALLAAVAGITVIFGLYPVPFAGITEKLGLGSADVPEFALSGGTIGQLIAAPETQYLPAGILRRFIGEVGTLITALVFLLTGLFFVLWSDWKSVFAGKLNFTISVRRKTPANEAESEQERIDQVLTAPPASEGPAQAPAKQEPYRVEPEQPAVQQTAGDQQTPPDNIQKYLEQSAVPEPSPVQPPVQPPVPPAPAPQAAPRNQNVPPQPEPSMAIINAKNGTNMKSSITSSLETGVNNSLLRDGYKLPPVTLFDEPKKVDAEDTAHLEHSKRVLQSVLDSFNIEGQVVRAVVGPRVTRFEIALKPGVKVALVTGLQNNIAMEMKAESVRILAPIPGEGNIGVEVPNKVSSIVYIRSIFESEEWQNSKGSAGSIPIVLGRDVAGRSVIANLAKAPHLLIAGSTGSGKSVCMNSLIMSLIQKFSPFDLRMILVDPKYVELAMYKPLPHLITPVVNDPRQVPLALRWADNEMERRYRVLAAVKAKNLKGFNSRPKPETPELDEDGNPIPDRMPLLVVIIDELADIMMTEAKKDVETSICRIAQKGRAAGIHLVIATQTPRKDVITGLIKANLPTKIAFRVTSGIDSRVILDSMGAESLLGNGDMLFLAPGGEGLERVQGTLVEDHEIQKVVDFVSPQVPQQFDSQVVAETEIVNTNETPAASSSSSSGHSFKTQAEADEDDELHETSLVQPSSAAVRGVVEKYLKPGDSDLMRRAMEIVLEEKRVSTSYLQRRLGIGYNKSAELIDELERRNIVSPPLPGGQKRDILILDELIPTNEYE